MVEAAVGTADRRINAAPLLAPNAESPTTIHSEKQVTAVGDTLITIKNGKLVDMR
jgi:hypothetical protein